MIVTVEGVMQDFEYNALANEELKQLLITFI